MKRLFLILMSSLSRRLITHSECLQELDLDDNLIGDLGGREILEALMDRKEGQENMSRLFQVLSLLPPLVIYLIPRLSLLCLPWSQWPRKAEEREPGNEVELPWTGLNCPELSWTALNCPKLPWTALNCLELTWTALNWHELILGLCSSFRLVYQVSNY